jgi:GR25 family glycosyltransferase involved in LPS biosynthesis
MNLVIYIICCNDEREAFMKQQMVDLKITYPIVYFKAFTPENSQDWVLKNDEINHNEKLQCCCRSHIEVLKDFLDKDKDFLLILEDDACLLKENFQDKLEKIVKVYKNNYDIIDFVSLGYIPQYLNSKTINTGFSSYTKKEMLYYNLENLGATVWGAQAQLFSIEKCKEMVEVFDKENGIEVLNSVKEYGIKYGYKQNKTIYLTPDSILPVIFKQSIIESHLAIERNFGMNTSIHLVDEFFKRKNSWIIGHDAGMYNITDFYSYE